MAGWLAGWLYEAWPATTQDSCSHDHSEAGRGTPRHSNQGELYAPVPVGTQLPHVFSNTAQQAFGSLSGGTASVKFQMGGACTRRADARLSRFKFRGRIPRSSGEQAPVYSRNNYRQQPAQRPVSQPIS
jgi:hypothetical protein